MLLTRNTISIRVGSCFEGNADGPLAILALVLIVIILRRALTR